MGLEALQQAVGIQQPIILEFNTMQLLVQAGFAGTVLVLIYVIAKVILPQQREIAKEHNETVALMARTYVEGREKHETMHREETQQLIDTFEKNMDRVTSGQEERTKEVRAIAEQTAINTTLLQQALRPTSARTRSTDNA